MFKIRLKKIGRTRINAFRIIATNSKNKRDTSLAKYDLGYYQPQNNKYYLKFDTDTYKKIISNGGIPTNRILKLYNIAINYDSKSIISKKSE